MNNPTDRDTITTRVARGAALLDQKEPGWVDLIDLDGLDVGSECRCILGQTWRDRGDSWNGFDRHLTVLFGNYSDSDIKQARAVEHGFDAHEVGADVEFRDLTAEWTRVVLARRAGGAA